MLIRPANKVLSWQWSLSRLKIATCLFYEWCWNPRFCLGGWSGWTSLGGVCFFAVLGCVCCLCFWFLCGCRGWCCQHRFCCRGTSSCGCVPCAGRCCCCFDSSSVLLSYNSGFGAVFVSLSGALCGGAGGFGGWV